MAGISCERIPQKAYGTGDSTLFNELLKITGNNRQKVKELYGLYMDSDLMKHMGVPVGQNEPSAVEFIDKLGLVNEVVSEAGYPDYINKKEGLGEAVYSSWVESAQKIFNLQESYPNSVFLISETDNGFRISSVVNTEENRIKAQEQQALANLNSRLISYMNSLGFTTSEVDGIEGSGKFSPLSARKNAENLIEIIKLSKGVSGQEALPEEFSHLIFEGIQNSTIAQRLISYLTNNDGLIELALGDTYNEYNRRYNGDRNLLAREVAARLIAQNIADRNGISSGISYISNRFLDYVSNIFKKGNESDVRKMLQDLNDSINKIVNDIASGDIISYFDESLVLNAREMYRVEGEVNKTKEIAENALKLLAKRIKILNLNKKDGKIDSADMIAYDEIKQAIEKQKYAKSISEFLQYSLDDVKEIYRKIKTFKEIMSSPSATVKQMKSSFSVLRDLEILLDAYSPIIKQLSTISEGSQIVSELPESSINDIEKSSKEVNDILDKLSTVDKEFRSSVLLKFYRMFWGDDKEINGKLIKLEDILQSNIGDTNVMGRLINSMSNMPDPLLQLVDIVYKNQRNQRDNNVYEIQQRLALIQKKLVQQTGSRDTSFMYVYEDGKPTGMIKSDRDYSAFYKAKHEYYLSIKDKGLSTEKLSARLHTWVIRNTEKVGNERMPRKSIYPSNALDSLTSAQREYYDAVMAIKEEMDRLIPQNRARKYRAVQKKVDSTEAVIGRFNIRGAFKRIKDNFVTSVDDTEFGEEVLDKNGKYVILDFSGNEVKKVPVYYTTFLDDMSLLDTNFTDSLLSYAAMAINYDSMQNISNVMELTISQMKDRRIIQTSGARKLYERFKIGDKAFGGDYTKSGENSELMKKLRNYVDANIYGRRKNKETTTIGNKEINVGKVADSIVRYNSLVGLGYNLFSGTTNISMGLAQTLIHAVGGKNFGLRDVAKAHIWYNKDLAGAIADQYQDVKKNKLNLLINRFDALEEFYEDLESSDYYGGVFKKIVGKHSPLIFNSMGEHYLHSICMLSILHNKKVLINGKKSSLYDALVVKEKELKNGQKVNEIQIADGVTKEDGSEFTEADLRQIKLEIQDANHRMHGAFNQTDMGDMNRSAVGRLIKQYRQWMPAFFMDRFKTKRLNVVTGKEEEGFYITAAKTIFGILNDAAHLKFNFATRFGNLSKEEKSNFRMAVFEVGLLYMLVGMLKYMGGPDKDDPWLTNVLKYNMYRLKMELGAAAPTSLDFLDNWKTLIQSPVPAMENIDRIINLLDLSTLGEEIQSGKYEGWNRWLRNAYFAAPFARNVGRTVDLVNGDVSMFTPYIKGRRN